MDREGPQPSAYLYLNQKDTGSERPAVRESGMGRLGLTEMLRGVAWLLLGCCMAAGPLAAQDNTAPHEQAEQRDKQEVLREKREADREKDDPRARAGYIRLTRGQQNGANPQAARLKAIEERDTQLRDAGRQFQQQAAAPGILPVRIQSNSSTWTPIGPAPTFTNNGVGSYQFASGRVTAIAVDPTDSNIVYAGGAQGGVWKTTNGNAADGQIVWTPLTDNKESLAMGAIAIDPNDHNIVYAGTGEASGSGDSYYGAGLLKSTDGGATWTRISNTSTAGFDGTNGKNGYSPSIGAISIQKTACPIGNGGDGNLAILMAVTYGTGFPGAGVYRSADGGTNWTGINTASGTAHDVQYAPNNNCVAYAAIGFVGISRSTNGGQSFTAVNNGLNLAGVGRIELAVVSDQVAYAALADNASGGLNGVYKTTNGGTLWTKLTIGDFCLSQCWYDLAIAVNPANANVVFVGGSAQSNIYVSKSGDAGTSWTGVAGAGQLLHVDQHAMAFSADGANFWVGNDGGVYRTTDTGTGTTVNWQDRNATLQLTQYYTYFTIDPADINRSLAGSQDNGVHLYDGGQPATSAWQEVACGDGAGAVIDFLNPQNVFANCQGVDIRKSTVGGSVGSFVGSDSGISDSNGLFIPPLVADPTDSNRLYFGASRLWQTRDSGATWNALSAFAVSNNGVSNIAVAPTDTSGNTVYAVTADGVFARSTNALAPVGSTTMPTVPTTGLPAGEYLSAIAVCPVQSYCANQTPKNVVYLVASGFGHGHVFKTTDASLGTVAWTDISGNLPNLPVNDIALDPDQPGTIYIGTDLGVYVSANDGATWASLANGLPNVAVFGLKLHRSSRTLRAVTHGRGAWDLYVPFAITGGPGAGTQPSALNFGKVAQGTTASPLPVALSNIGDQTLTISGISINNVTEFSQFNNCPATLAVGASCTIEVQFTPSAAGARTGTLTINSNALNGPQNVALNGNGAVFAQNDLFVNATVVTSGGFTDSVDTTQTTNQDGTDPLPDEPCVGTGFSGAGRFHTIWYDYRPGSSGTMSLDTVNSTYDTVLTVWTGSGPGNLAEVACSDDINPGIVQQSTLPSVSVTGGTTYHIMLGGYGLNSTSNGTATFHLNGPAPSLSPSQTVSANLLSFSPVVPGQSSASKPVTLTAVNANVSSIVINASGDFSQTNNCGSSLTAATSCTINVTFSPTALGARTGSLTVSSNATNSPSTVTLNGDGRDPFIIQVTRPVRPVKSGAELVVTAGANLDIPVQITGTDTNGGVVSLGCENVPRGVSCAVEPATLQLSQAAQLVHMTLSIGKRSARAARLGVAPDGLYQVRIVARMGKLSKSIDVPVRVQAAPVVPGRSKRLAH